MVTCVLAKGRGGGKGKEVACSINRRYCRYCASKLKGCVICKRKLKCTILPNNGRMDESEEHSGVYSSAAEAVPSSPDKAHSQSD